jgi:hypothetical protein
MDHMYVIAFHQGFPIQTILSTQINFIGLLRTRFRTDRLADECVYSGSSRTRTNAII